MDSGTELERGSSSPLSDHISSQPSKRTAEDVSTSAKAAGLSNSVGSVQLLQFSAQLHSEEIRLMEVHGPILSALRNGEK